MSIHTASPPALEDVAALRADLLVHGVSFLWCARVVRRLLKPLEQPPNGLCWERIRFLTQLAQRAKARTAANSRPCLEPLHGEGRGTRVHPRMTHDRPWGATQTLGRSPPGRSCRPKAGNPGSFPLRRTHGLDPLAAGEMVVCRLPCPPNLHHKSVEARSSGIVRHTVSGPSLRPCRCAKTG